MSTYDRFRALEQARADEAAAAPEAKVRDRFAGIAPPAGEPAAPAARPRDPFAPPDELALPAVEVGASRAAVGGARVCMACAYVNGQFATQCLGCHESLDHAAQRQFDERRLADADAHAPAARSPRPELATVVPARPAASTSTQGPRAARLAAPSVERELGPDPVDPVARTRAAVGRTLAGWTRIGPLATAPRHVRAALILASMLGILALLLAPGLGTLAIQVLLTLFMIGLIVRHAEP